MKSRHYTWKDFGVVRLIGSQDPYKTLMNSGKFDGKKYGEQHVILDSLGDLNEKMTDMREYVLHDFNMYDDKYYRFAHEQ